MIQLYKTAFDRIQVLRVGVVCDRVPPSELQNAKIVVEAVVSTYLLCCFLLSSCTGTGMNVTPIARLVRNRWDPAKYQMANGAAATPDQSQMNEIVFAILDQCNRRSAPLCHSQLHEIKSTQLRAKKHNRSWRNVNGWRYCWTNSRLSLHIA